MADLSKRTSDLLDASSEKNMTSSLPWLLKRNHRRREALKGDDEAAGSVREGSEVVNNSQPNPSVFDILPQRKPASCLAVNDTGKDVKSAEGFFPGSFGDVVKSEEKEIVSDEDEEGSEEDYTTEEDDGNNEGDNEVNDDRHAIALGFTKECSEVISNGEIKLNHVENCYEVVDLERKEVSAVKRKQTEDKEVQVIDAHQVFDGRPETFFGKEKQGSALDVDRISISESPLPGFCALEVGLNGGPGVDAMKTHRGNKGDKHNHMLDTLTGPIADANTAAVSHQVFGEQKGESGGKREDSDAEIECCVSDVLEPLRPDEGRVSYVEDPKPEDKSGKGAEAVKPVKLKGGVHEDAEVSSDDQQIKNEGNVGFANDIKPAQDGPSKLCIPIQAEAKSWARVVASNGLPKLSYGGLET
ncbi:hypothetical protein U1Q18_014494 [Sarracenia purpurea var. burkii]